MRTDRDTTTRTRARAPGAEDYSSSRAVHNRVVGLTLSRSTESDYEVYEGRRQTRQRLRHAGSELNATLCWEGPV